MAGAQLTAGQTISQIVYLQPKRRSGRSRARLKDLFAVTTARGKRGGKKKNHGTDRRPSVRPSGGWKNVQKERKTYFHGQKYRGMFQMSRGKKDFDRLDKQIDVAEDQVDGERLLSTFN